MNFNPKPYAEGIIALNISERRLIEERLKLARHEAERITQAIVSVDATVRRVYLFGSVAEGNPGRIDFDIDIALDGGDAILAMETTGKSSFPIDVVSFETLPLHLRERILKRGKLLFER